MSQVNKAKAFAAMHVPGNPVVIFNIWDAGSAKAVAKSGAKALATGSWSVAAAQGFADGEAIPLDLLFSIAERIVDSTELPVSIDMEGGYARDPASLEKNITRLIDTGAIGLNFEDQIVGAPGIYDIAEQSDRVAAVSAAADTSGVPLFINARTDLFLKDAPANTHESRVDEALERAQAYAAAGASGFFVPGLTDQALIKRVCNDSPLPVNVMMLGQSGGPADLAPLGIARASYGPGPYRTMMAALSTEAAQIS